MVNIEELYRYIIDNNIATEEELNLIIDIFGYNEEVLNNVLYAKTGYRDIEQHRDSELLDE